MLTKTIPLDIVRRCYAEDIRFAARLRSVSLAEAFASTPRELYAGPGPWHISKAGGYVLTETNDPRELYHDALVAADMEKQLNIGQPSALGGFIDALDLTKGSTVFHLGCGTGYYTAIMAEVVGSVGHITAIEVEPVIAQRAKSNLGHLEQVSVACADANLYDPGPSDAVLVNFGVTHPRRLWLERLNNGGTLLVPLTVVRPDISANGSGQMLLVRRISDRYEASLISPVGIYSSQTGRDSEYNRILSQRFYEKMTGVRADPRSVRLDSHSADGTCWLHTGDSCLSTLPCDAQLSAASHDPCTDEKLRL